MCSLAEQSLELLLYIVLNNTYLRGQAFCSQQYKLRITMNLARSKKKKIGDEGV